MLDKVENYVPLQFPLPSFCFSPKTVWSKIGWIFALWSIQHPYKGCSTRQILLRAYPFTFAAPNFQIWSSGSTFMWSALLSISRKQALGCKSRKYATRRARSELPKEKLKISSFRRLHFHHFWEMFGRPDFWISLLLGLSINAWVRFEIASITL